MPSITNSCLVYDMKIKTAPSVDKGHILICIVVINGNFQKDFVKAGIEQSEAQRVTIFDLFL